MKHGERGTELNALMHETRCTHTEAMLREAIRGLRDGTLPDRLRASRREAQRILEEEPARRLLLARRALELIEEQALKAGGRYEQELRNLSKRLARERRPLEERVLQAARRRLAGVEEVELPEVEVV